ncbi:DUF502 domain-containing protein [Algoriphagus aestuarii]|nr:DUF502 domain-containing protein [Algoriphagus aestuarii]
MKNSINILNQLLKGGIFFLFPLVLLILFFEKAIHLIRPIATVIGEKLSLDNTFFYTPYIFTIIILLLFCLLAGFIASKGLGSKMILWIEDHLLSLFPGYKLMKNTLQNTAGLNTEFNYPVVLAPIDGWVLGFQVDELESGEVVIFIPSAPNTWEGNVIIFQKDEIRETNIQQKDVNKLLRQLGVNSKDILKGLTIPSK